MSTEITKTFQTLRVTDEGQFMHTSTVTIAPNRAEYTQEQVELAYEVVASSRQFILYEKEDLSWLQKLLIKLFF